MSQKDYENKTPTWKSEFQTQIQVDKNITTEESLREIEDASRYGVKVNTGGNVVVPQNTVGNKTVTQAIRDAGALEDKKQSAPNNPFANANAKRPQPKPMIDLTK